MSLHVHALTRWRIERLFTGRLGPRGHRALAEELRACPDCSRVYARYDALEASLCGEPSGFALDRVEAAVLDRVGEMPSASPRRRMALVALASAACAVVLVVALRPAQERVPLGPDVRLAGIAARGELAPRSANVGIRVLRATPKGSALAEPSSLTVADVMTFTWTDVEPAARYVSVFGVQQDGRIRWYYPQTRLEGLQVDEPFGDGFRLLVRHAPGWLRVTALFSAKPLPDDEVERAVRSQGAAVERLEPLPMGEGVLEHSLRLDITAGESP